MDIRTSPLQIAQGLEQKLGEKILVTMRNILTIDEQDEIIEIWQRYDITYLEAFCMWMNQ